MKTDRIHDLCREISSQGDLNDPVAKAKAILSVANREHIPAAMLYSIYDRFGFGDQTRGAGQNPGSERSGQNPGSGQSVKSGAGRSVKVEICMGKACKARGADALLDHFTKLGTGQGLASGSPIQYKIRTCSCLGRCNKAPVVKIDKTVHEKFKLDE